MRILITNDDGIGADGIIRLAKFAKVHGEVYVVAPESQRSAASHSISLHNPIDIFPYDFPVEGVHAFACSGTPGDCIRLGCLNVMKEKPDFVLSGINFGYNIASDIQYSATVGAAMEAVFQGVPAIAFSEGNGPLTEVTDKYLPGILEELLQKDYMPGHIYNVNFPECTLEECKGILYDRKVSRGMIFRDRYNEIEKLENGGIRYMVEGIYNEDAEEGTDFKALLDKYVSVGLVNNLGEKLLG